ncbi:unnamed protein product [Amoebophrya sp. A120]|nr:unnamed protein product [Amoebophrya sp. A120]|eukprot:GSA120T00023854001.1
MARICRIQGLAAPSSGDVVAERALRGRTPLVAKRAVTTYPLATSAVLAASVAPGAATSRRSAGACLDPSGLWADKSCDARSGRRGAVPAARLAAMYLVVQKTLRRSADYTPLLHTEPPEFHHSEGCNLLRTYELNKLPARQGAPALCWG